MKIKIEIPEFEWDFELYWFYRRGGYKIDKRTKGGKEDIKDAINMDMKKHIKLAKEFNMHPAMVCTSINTREKLFTFRYLN